MRISAFAAFAALGFGLAACGPSEPPRAAAPQPAAAAAAPGAAPSVADLRGARASSGEGEMQRRGYTVARQRGLTAYWSHPAGSCVRTVTSGGRYTTVAAARPADCGR